MNEDFWRDAINSLNIERDLPDEENSNSDLMLKEASVLRVNFDMYLISPTGGGNKAYMVNASQEMEDCGVMPIKEALALIKERKRKKE